MMLKGWIWDTFVNSDIHKHRHTSLAETVHYVNICQMYFLFFHFWLFFLFLHHKDEVFDLHMWSHALESTPDQDIWTQFFRYIWAPDREASWFSLDANILILKLTVCTIYYSKAHIIVFSVANVNSYILFAFFVIMQEPKHLYSVY